MDTSDPEIIFDDTGICNHCRTFDEHAKKHLVHGAEQAEKLKEITDRIHRAGKGKRYDCIIGVSGGVDSTYVAYVVKQQGLRPLAVHFDNGWDSELAVSNVEKTLKTLGIDLFTYVMDWGVFRDLQLAFLRASTPDSEIPSDHAIVALLYQVAARENVRFIIMGTNVQTEGILPRAWSHGHVDWKYIRTLHKRFGTVPLRKYPHYSLFRMAYYVFMKRIRGVSILNYIKYDKAEALRILQDKLGWRDYGGKHFESTYTRFFQGYILPNKFGYDKRRAHLSTLVCSGQITREEALRQLDVVEYSPAMQREDLEYVTKKLRISEEEFKGIMQLPKKTFWDYPSYERGPMLKIAKLLYPPLRNV